MQYSRMQSPHPTPQFRLKKTIFVLYLYTYIILNMFLSTECGMDWKTQKIFKEV